MADTPRRPGDPVVGPADPATVHRMIEKQMREDADYRKRHPLDLRNTNGGPEHDHMSESGANPHRELRRGPEGKTIMQSVDEASRGKK